MKKILATEVTGGNTHLPLSNLRVVEYSHMVMGPSCGMILGDMGADVIKVEPIKGDTTRQLKGSGAGFFTYFNRNKRSLALDAKSDAGREIMLRLLARADVMSENFRPGAMQNLGLDYESLKSINERLIYVSHKGFLNGPYENRTALDEVVQMMGGLAYMTGSEGHPTRAGASINDIMGGMFGAMGVLAALLERAQTGRGQKIDSALFENNVFLMGQHMAQFAITGQSVAPMPSRISAWGIYDVFTVKNDEQIFLAVVTDHQWKLFCQAFDADEWKVDERLVDNNQRVEARSWFLPQLRQYLQKWDASEIAERCTNAGLPFAPITTPEDLFDDVHLKRSGGLQPVRLPNGDFANLPILPIQMDARRFGVREQPPQVGQHGEEILAELGYSAVEIGTFQKNGWILLPDMV